MLLLFITSSHGYSNTIHYCFANPVDCFCCKMNNQFLNSLFMALDVDKIVPHRISAQLIVSDFLSESHM